VENRPGSGTLVGTDAAARATPDGYTLLMGSVSNIALNMGLYQKLSYDSLRDFESVGLAVSYGYTLVARRDLPFGSLRELIAHARANPDKLTYASAGNGSGQHVLAAALWHLAGVKVVHVPYKGAQAVYPDLIGGRVDVLSICRPPHAPRSRRAQSNRSPPPGPTGAPFIPMFQPSSRAVFRLISSRGLATSRRQKPQATSRKGCAGSWQRSSQTASFARPSPRLAANRCRLMLAPSGHW